MSHDTQVKQEDKTPNPHNAPDEIWLGLRGKSWEWDGSWSPRPFPINERIVVERYVRADLLATVRREEREAAFRDIRGLIETVNPALTFGAANGSMMKRAILGTVDTFIESDAAIHRAKVEASANQKGEVNG